MQKGEGFRGVLKSELSKRQSKNPYYSLRAFARDLGISPARLSDVMNGRYGLSVAAASKLASKLDFSGPEEKEFVESVVAAKAEKRSLQSVKKPQKPFFDTLREDQFMLISEWYHYAILEVACLKRFEDDPKWIARYLKISETEARLGIERLERLGLLVRTAAGKLTPSNDWTATTEDVPSEALKKHQIQILEKAKAALASQSVEKRHISAVTFAVNRSRIPEAKKMILEFREKFTSYFGKSRSKNSIYCLGIQLFELGGDREV